MTTNKNSTTTALPVERPGARPRRLPNLPMVQNFHLVWLDESIDEDNDNCRNSIVKLREVVNTVNTFTDIDECIDFITDIEKTKTFMIISETFIQIIVSITQDISQVKSVYIFGENKMKNEKWTKQSSKVKGVFTDITLICEALKQPIVECDQNLISISFIKTPDGVSNQNLDQLDQSFMYSQILKENLLTIDFDQLHINEFLKYCREQFLNNSSELKNVDQIEKEYHQHQPIWWYTCPCFLYSMLNRALRLMEVDLIIKLGFFIRDLHNHITALHLTQYEGHHPSDSFTVYRGQGLSQTDFDQLMKTKGGLMSFNNFLSTSLDRAVSLTFAESNRDDSDLIGVLFEITIDSSISSSPFANVANVSYFKGEEEILFSMHSIFRIGHVKSIDKNGRLWQVDLILTSDNDPQLCALTECMREETQGSTGWDRLGKLMIKLGQFNKARELYEILLKQTTGEDEKGHLFHMLGIIKDKQGEHAEAVEFYEKSIEIKQKILPSTHPDLAFSYNNIGVVYFNMDECSKALSNYEKALEIREKALPANHLDFAMSYNNIGSVYSNMGEYSKALSYYEKGLKIRQETLPANHPDLGICYNNIGSMYEKMGEYLKAVSYYEKALEIYQKSLPANHPNLAISYNGIGNVYDSMEEYSKALSYYEKAFVIWQKTLPVNHPHLATSYNNIGEIYKKMGEYSKAFSYYEKALGIRQKTLPANHSDLAASYNSIGLVCDDMREYSKARLYFEKVLKIKQKTLPANHPHLAIFHNVIGGMYYKMGEYSKAVSYYEKALEISEKTLPTNHPDLAAAYNNIGKTYKIMGEYSRALLYFEKDLKISENNLPANHPTLATSYKSIAEIYYKMSEYSKALSYDEKVLEIQEKTLPANHPDLALAYGRIGVLSSNMGEHSKAVLYCQRSLKIIEHSLPPDDPGLQIYKDTLEFVKKKL